MRNIVGLILIGAILTWFAFLFTFRGNFDIKETQIQTIVYTTTQTAAKKGMLSTALYNSLKSKLRTYGLFNIDIQAEQYVGSSTTPIILRDQNVIDYDLRGNGYDIITIYVQDVNVDALAFIYRVSPFGVVNSSLPNIRLVGNSSGFIQ